MLASVLSSAIKALEGFIVKVEIDIAGGAPTFTIVGLPEQEVKEAKDLLSMPVLTMPPLETLSLVTTA